MRLAKVWRGRSRCKLLKFPYGSKMSATLVIDFLMCARCFSRTLSGQFPLVCVQYVCICVCSKSHLEQIVDSGSATASGQNWYLQFGFRAVAFRHSCNILLSSSGLDYRVKVRVMVRVRRVLVMGTGYGKPPRKKYQ